MTATVGTLQFKTFQLDQASGSVQLLAAAGQTGTLVVTFPSIGSAQIPTLQATQLAGGGVPFADANGFMTTNASFSYSVSGGLLAASLTMTGALAMGGALSGATTIGCSSTITSSGGGLAIAGTITGATTVGLDYGAFAAQATNSTDGAMFYESTHKALHSRTVGLDMPLIGTLFVSTASHAAITNAGPTTMFGTGVGTLTIPANFLVAGRSLRIDITGTITTAATSPTLNLFCTLGGANIVTTGAKALTTGITTGDFHAIAIITARAAPGATSRVDCNVIFMHNNATSTMSMVGGKGNANFNTTGALALDFTCTTAGTGSTTVTPTMGIVTIMN